MNHRKLCAWINTIQSVVKLNKGCDSILPIKLLCKNFILKYFKRATNTPTMCRISNGMFLPYHSSQ